MTLKEIKGYENYLASSDGFIVSKRTHQPIQTFMNNCGYLHVGLTYAPNKKRNVYLHRIIAETFIPNPNGYTQVNHKDENKINNSVDNLEWCSPSYNIRYGTAPKIRATKRGHPVQQVETGLIFPSITEASRRTGVDKQSICNVVNGRGQTAGGFHWIRYKEVS